MNEILDIGPLATQVYQNLKDSTELPVSKFLKLKADAEAVFLFLKDEYEKEVSKRRKGMVWDEQTLAAIDLAAKWFFAGNRDGLLLYGQYGNGKTTLLNCIRRLFKMDRLWDDVLMVTTAMVIEDMNSGSRDENLYRRCCDVDVLLMDEVGVEESTSIVWGTRRTPIQDIIVHRYDRREITVISSNLDDNGLMEKYGLRVMDRIGESYTRIAYPQGSYRNPKK